MYYNSNRCDHSYRYAAVVDHIYTVTFQACCPPSEMLNKKYYIIKGCVIADRNVK